MFRQYQYPKSFEVKTTSYPEQVHVDAWQQPQSQPIPTNFVKRAAGYAIALIAASGLFWSTFTPAPPPTPSQSGGSVNQVNRLVFKQRFACQSPAAFWSTFTPSPPPPAPSSDWIPQQNQPPAGKQYLNTANQQSEFWSTFTPSTTSGGGSPPDYNYFTIVRSYCQTPATFWSGFTPTPAVTVTYVQPVYPDSVPGKRYLLTAQQQAVFWNTSTSPEVVHADAFVQPQSQPYPYKKALLEAIDVTDGTAVAGQPPDGTDVEWQQPQAQPYPYRKAIPTAEVPAFFWNTSTSPETVTEDRWHQPASQPYPYRKALLTAQQQATFWNTSTSPENVSVDRWEQQQSQPTPGRVLLTAQQQAFFSGNFTPAVLTTLVEPVYPDSVQGKRYLTEAVDTSDGGNLGGPPDVIEWQQPQNQPVQPRRYLTAEQQATFWNISTSSETVTEDRWHQPVSQPYPYTRALQTAEQLAFFWQPFTPGDFTFLNHWEPIYPQPWPKKLYLLTAQQQAVFWNTSTSPEQVHVDAWQQPQSQPVQSKKYLTEALDSSDAQAPLGQPPDGIDPSVWFSQPQPSRQRVFLAAQQQAFFSGVFTPSAAFFNWQPVYPDSVSKKLYLTEAVDTTDGAVLGNPPDVIEWQQPQSQPVQPKRYLTAEQQALFWNVSTQPEVTTIDRYEGSSADVIRAKFYRAVYEPASNWSTFTPPVVNQPFVVYPDSLPRKRVVQPESVVVPSITFARELGWQQPQSQPYPYKKALLEAVDVTDGQAPLGTPPDGTDPSVWQPQSQPTPRRILLTAEIPSFFWNTSTSPEVVTEDRWHPTWPQPWPGKKNILTAQQQAFFWQPNTPGDFTFLLHWEPVYPQPWPKKLYPLTANQQATFWHISTAQEAVTEDRWHQPVSQPYPFKPYRPAALYPYHFWNTSTSPEQVHVDAWQQPQSLPKAKPYPRAVYEPVNWTPFTPVQVSLDWFQRTQQPVRKIVRTTTGDIVLVQSIETGWQQPFVQLVPTKKPLQLEAASFVPDPAVWVPTILPEQRRVTINRAVYEPASTAPAQVIERVFTNWLPTYPERVYPQRQRHASQQQATFWNTFTPPEVIDAGKFTQPISQPYPYRRALATAEQQATFWHISTQQEPTSEDRWHPTYPQPFPIKPYLTTAQIPYFFWHISTEQEEVVVSSWIQPIEQPYPYQRVLGTAQQLTFTWYISEQGEEVLVSSWHPLIEQPYPYRKDLLTDLQLASVWNSLTPPPVVAGFVSGRGEVTLAINPRGTATVEVAGSGVVDLDVKGRGQTG